MRKKYIVVRSLIEAYNSLGLTERIRKPAPDDASPEAIRAKVTNHIILQNLGVTDRLVEASYNAELAANYADCYAEYGQTQFLIDADKAYRKFLSLIPKESKPLIMNIVGSAIGYFLLEKYFSERVKRNDEFSILEAMHYHLSRGADSQVYAEIAKIENKDSAGMIAGFRHRQALWDLSDEILDLEADKKRLGVNILLMAHLDDKVRLREFAGMLYTPTNVLSIPRSLREHIQSEYDKTVSIIG